ncbi:MAG TPA: glycosyltransferase family 39 protein [Anaerolineaceae bacterium]
MPERMNTQSTGAIQWRWLLFYGLLSAAVLLQSSPWVVQTPGNDSGIFLYFGAQILHGKLPFVQLWDHKPPLVFYLDALGFLLSGGSRWGVWALEVLSLLAASLCAFGFLRRYFGRWAALLAVSGMLVSLSFVLEGGNLTEEFALPFQFAALLLFAGMEDGRRPGWRGYVLGVAMGCAFLLKQTLVGVWLAIGIYLLAAALFTRAYRGLWILAQMLAGFAVVLLASLAYFALRGGLAAYWDVAFWYNFVYSSVASIERLNSLLDALAFLNTRAGFFLLAVMAWAAGIIYVMLHHEPSLWQITRRRAGFLFLAGALIFLVNGLFDRPFHLYALAAISLYRWSLIATGAVLLLTSLAFFTGWAERRLYAWAKQYQSAGDGAALLPVYLAIIDLPVELAMVSVSGRGYLHYYLCLFPPLTVLVAFLIWQVGAAGRKRSERAMPLALSGLLLIPVLYGGVVHTIEKIRPGTDLQTTKTVLYIRENTQPQDTILLWGTQTGIYYLSGRDAPTRYVHQIPLYNARYGTPQRIQEFLGNLEAKKPALIIDTRLPDMPLVYGDGSPQACSQSQAGQPVPAGMERVFLFICSNYQFAGTVGPDSWPIYRYNPAVRSAGN